MKVSFCIANYGAEAYLKQCLESIYQNPPSGEFEVIIVDDSSPDGSVGMVRSCFPQVKLQVNAQNSGFAVSTNRAMSASRGEYLMILNNDTRVLSGSIDALIVCLDKFPEVGAVGPMVLNPDGTFQPQCKRGMLTPMSALAYVLGLDRLFPHSCFFGEYLLRLQDPGVSAEVKGLSGAAMLVRRSVLGQVGMIDEGIHMYGEDLDWCYRMRGSGWSLRYEPTARIIHYGGMGGSSLRSYYGIYAYHRCILILFNRYSHAMRILPYRLVVTIAVMARFFIVFVSNVFRCQKRVGTRKHVRCRKIGGV